MKSKLILDLCGGTGAWSNPYAEHENYEVIVVDPLAENNGSNFIGTIDEFMFNLPAVCYGILMAPPCTEYAASGARWWASKPAILLQESNKLVRLCLSIKDKLQPTFWALENPVGRIAKQVPELGKPRLIFDPFHYGDRYTKKTCIWGNFNIPPKQLNDKMGIDHAIGRSPIYLAPPSPDRAKIRSITPNGFARAFFAANR